jgi:hypothetical protein
MSKEKKQRPIRVNYSEKKEKALNELIEAAKEKGIINPIKR